MDFAAIFKTFLGVWADKEKKFAEINKTRNDNRSKDSKFQNREKLPHDKFCWAKLERGLSQTLKLKVHDTVFARPPKKAWARCPVLDQD